MLFISFSFLPLAIPDKPKIQNANGFSSTSITLSWKFGQSNGGRPVTSTIIEYLQDGGKWRRETVQGGKTRHTIYNLKPGTEYTTRVIAVNEIGQGPPSDIMTVKTSGKNIQSVGNISPQDREDSKATYVEVFEASVLAHTHFTPASNQQFWAISSLNLLVTASKHICA